MTAIVGYWTAYLACVVGAVLTGHLDAHWLVYGAFSWTGGALFTLLVLHHTRPPVPVVVVPVSDALR